MRVARPALFVAALALPLLSPITIPPSGSGQARFTRPANSRSALVDAVRQATEPFRDVRNVPAGYGPTLGCVTGPDQGAMGVHYVNGGLLLDPTLNKSQPEALIYESTEDGARLVAVEFIVLAEAWHLTHAPNDPPVLEGQLLHFVDAPNRFGLPAFYELHVWAWQENPNGAFTDWNPHATCEGQ
jgi:hypothetical protein